MNHPDILPDGPWMLRACCTECEQVRSYDVLIATRAVALKYADGIQVTANLACPQQHQNHFVTTPLRWKRFTAAFPERRQKAS